MLDYKVLLVLFIYVKMSSSYLAYLNINDAIDELYGNIIDGKYSQAVKLTRNISDTNNHGVFHHGMIAHVVEKLAQEMNPNILSYGYKLWSSGEKEIVKKYLPNSFPLIFDENDVILMDRQYNLALKLDVNIDSAGDRKVWGDSRDKTSRRVIWKVLPIWENSKVHFKLKNLDCNQFLKMGLYPDGIKDRPVYGDNKHDEMRHTWYLDPVFLNGKYSFFIRNRQFGQKLKLAVKEDSYKDRRLWGHYGDINDNDLPRFLWDIVKHE
ncbi:unnamed protein product [Chilo suppressalis]|uniref:Uncharacterized protein n=1 Tax=Chilo suppressalis TaxID=168631 RepID=A0ABN8B4E5_CHISP|nr:unnamed protein product [Chilo suppressalis]